MAMCSASRANMIAGPKAWEQGGVAGVARWRGSGCRRESEQDAVGSGIVGMTVGKAGNTEGGERRSSV